MPAIAWDALELDPSGTMRRTLLFIKIFGVYTFGPDGAEGGGDDIKSWECE